MARNLADVAAIDAVITGAGKLPDRDLRTVRLGVPRRVLWENLDSEVAAICEAALRRIGGAGVTFVEADIEALAEFDTRASIAVSLFEFAPSLGKYLRERGARITYEHVLAGIASSDVRALTTLAQSVTAAEYSHAIEVVLPALRRAYRDYFAAHRLDGYLFPTTPITAPPIVGSESGRVEINGVEQPGGPAALFATVIRNLDASSLAGIPSVAFPAGLTRGALPVGLEIDGPVRSDRDLLGIGSAIESLLGGVPAPQEPRV
jgi:mandelamide amidase